MGQECTISAYQRVRIGEQCVIADRAMFIDFDHGVVEVERPIRAAGHLQARRRGRLQRLDRLRRLHPARRQRRRQLDRRHQLGGDQGRPRQRRRRRHPRPDHPHARGARGAALGATGRARPGGLDDDAAAARSPSALKRIVWLTMRRSRNSVCMARRRKTAIGGGCAEVRAQPLPLPPPRGDVAGRTRRARLAAPDRDRDARARAPAWPGSTR